MDRQLEHLITQYKKNAMSLEEERLLEEYISSGKLTINDFQDLDHINNQLSEIIPSEPSKSLDVKFYTMLGEAKVKSVRKFWLKNWFGNLPLSFQYALPLILLIVGISIGLIIPETSHDQNAINTQDQTLMTSLIQGHSTSDRIMAVKESAKAKVSEEGLVKALLFSLNSDKSENVRIAAIEALLKYAASENVRKGLIDAIRYQTSPLVIMNLAEALKLIGNEIPIDQYKDMLNKDLPLEAIQKIEEGLRII